MLAIILGFLIGGLLPAYALRRYVQRRRSDAWDVSTRTARYGQCRVPPAGWMCTRGARHEGPCAAVPRR
jgi:hypothetical protein